MNPLMKFDLERAWNCNMSLKFAVKRAALANIGKDTVVKFWRDSARKLGYWGSYPIPKVQGRGTPSSGYYAEWLGITGQGALLKQICLTEKVERKEKNGK